MRNDVNALVGTDDMGDLVLDLLTGSLVPTSNNNYDTGMRRFTVFRDEEGITPLQATSADMLRFTTWLARTRTAEANGFQPSSKRSTSARRQRSGGGPGGVRSQARRYLPLPPRGGWE
jgi:hypothetical protein